MERKMKYASTILLSGALLLSHLPFVPTHVIQAATSFKTQLDQSKPYYYYNGYFKPNSRAVLTTIFKNAIANKNIKINGYMVSKTLPKKPYAPHMEYVKDVLVNQYNKYIVGINLPIDSRKVSKSEIIQSYNQSFKLVNKRKAGNQETYTYANKKGKVVVSVLIEAGKVKSVDLK